MRIPYDPIIFYASSQKVENMPKSKELDEGNKASILILLKENEREVATKLSVSKAAVHYIKQKHK